MATIKAYTDLSQSKKLAEILPPESADMHYKVNRHNNESKIFMIPYSELGHYKDNDYQYCVCAWSLAALLGVLPFPVLYMEMLAGMILWSCECHFIETKEVVKIEHYNNPVDACYELILKLHELKML